MTKKKQSYSTGFKVQVNLGRSSSHINSDCHSVSFRDWQQLRVGANLLTTGQELTVLLKEPPIFKVDNYVVGKVVGKVSGSLDALEFFDMKYLNDSGIETINLLTTFAGSLKDKQAGSPCKASLKTLTSQRSLFTIVPSYHYDDLFALDLSIHSLN